MSLYNYVDTPNNNLICCICRAPFTDPFTTKTCAHTFCYGCILRALSDSGAQCPVDRSALSVDDLCPANPIVRSMVDELIVECVHVGEGCKHRCERQRMESHLKEECEYGQVVCSVGGCEETMQRWEMAGHIEKDHARGKKEKKREEGEEGMEGKEEKEGESAERSEVISRCRHAGLGCECEGGSSCHREGCVYEKLQGIIGAQNTRIGQLAEQNVLLRQRVGTLEGTVQTLRQEVSGMKGTVGGLETRTVGLGEEVGQLGAVVDGVGRRSEMALTNETLRLSEEMMSIRAQMHGLRMQMHGMMMDREYARTSSIGSITKL